MRGLAIETSGKIGSIAAAIDGRTLADETFPHGLQHAAQIIPIIDRLCSGLGWKPGEIDELYVSAGPGSFTGLRIGITLAKTMALATGVKLVAVPSVHVLVENAPDEAQHVVIVLDAKRDQIFTARFERAKDEGGRMKDETGDPHSSFILHPSSFSRQWIDREPAHLGDVPAMLARSPRPVHLLGEGIPYHQKFIPANDPGVIVTPEDAWRARASVVSRIGHDLARQGQLTDPMTLTPIYIRIPEAEEKWQQNQNIARSPGTF